MANVTNLSNGSKGSEVKKLQEALINAGYDVGKTGADGVLGKNTEAAIRQYQKDNGLTVDGIAGKNTQGSLYGTSNNKGNAGGSSGSGSGGNNNKVDPVQPAAPTAPVEEPVADKPILYGNFTAEEIAAQKNLINEASNVLNQAMGRNPGAFNWGADADYGMANDYLSQYQNRDPFSYDPNSDALYNMYKDQYIQQGQLAMMDTMGQAAAMTGGYGNSYAQSVGQQTYNQYMGKLNEVVPELYGMAYDRYNQEGKDMLNMYDIYMGRANDSYNRHMDSVDLWQNEVAMAKDNYTTLLNEYTSAYDQSYTEKQDAKKWEYTETQDATTRVRDMLQAGVMPSDADLKAAGYTKQQAQDMVNAYTTSVTSGDGTGGTEYEPLDVKTLGEWDTRTKRAESWGSLAGYWSEMIGANHDPLASATYLMQKALNNEAVKPTYEDLMTFGEKMINYGISEDAVNAFIYEWQSNFGLTKENKLPLDPYRNTTGGGGRTKDVVNMIM